MSEPQIDEYEALSREFRNAAGPLEYLTEHVQDGIEVEAFRKTRAGKVLVGAALRRARAALVLILTPSLTESEVIRAVDQLRVQHRVLQDIADAVSMGKEATRRILSQESQEDTES